RPRSIARIVDVRADEIRRQEVGRELDAAELAAERRGERLHGERLRESRHAFQKDVTVGEESDEESVDERLLSDDDAFDLADHVAEELALLGDPFADGFYVGRR